jgi:hypothetical protein
MNFDFFGWVKYKDPNSGLADDIALGRWLGVAHSVVQAMIYWVLKSNGYIIAHSTVRSITDKELRSEAVKLARDSFMTELTAHVGDFDPDRIHTDTANTPNEMAEPMFDHDSDPIPDEPAPVAATTDEVSGPEPIRNA